MTILTVKRSLLILLLTIAGATLAFVLNRMIENLIIPDPCYYHDHESTRLFRLFYEFPSSEGYHPTPTQFNNILTLAIGTLSGFLLSIYIIKRKQKRHRRADNSIAGGD